ncbi:DUF1868 domain-containing protein [Asaia siamensis]|uniref:DUF1868 domain-containing protein n=1 Tax=Asaia siamensis TaxID=110479 RepID=A0ABQ1M0L1_9PROT|nr:DUF1868 domain-containing protein [Asaia siamensis]GGC31715.1 hypothetical protein GCM10007207_16510 [Asaia siamensis]
MRRVFPSAAGSSIRRRDILLGLGALMACGAAPAVATLEKEAPACDAGTKPEGGDRQGKFDAKGQPLIWPGNTIICPFNAADPLAQAMLDMNSLIEREWREYITPTPPSSYHMTILGGVDPEQQAKANWPSGINTALPIADTASILRDRLASRRFDIPETIEMEIDADRFHAPLVGVPLRPANAAMATALYDLRRQLAEAIGFHPDNLMTFMFHATYGYKIRHVPRAQKDVLRRQVHNWRRENADKLGTIVIPPPVFCSFETMFAFKPLLTLARRA